MRERESEIRIFLRIYFIFIVILNVPSWVLSPCVKGFLSFLCFVYWWIIKIWFRFDLILVAHSHKQYSKLRKGINYNNKFINMLTLCVSVWRVWRSGQSSHNYLKTKRTLIRIILFYHCLHHIQSTHALNAHMHTHTHARTHTHTHTHTECLLCNPNVILNMQHMESLAKFSVHTYNLEFF